MTSSIRPWLAAALGLALGAAACGPRVREIPDGDVDPSPSRPSPLAAEARAGVTDPGLADLLVDHLDAAFHRSPVWATTLGDRRFDHVIGDTSDAAERRWRGVSGVLLARARAIGAGQLDAADRLTVELLIEDLDDELGAAPCEFHLWSVSPRDNPLYDLGTLPDEHPVTSAASAAGLLDRYRAFERRFDDEAANLELGARRGLHGNAESIRRTIAMLDAELARPIPAWAFMVPARDGGPRALPADARRRFVAELGTIVERDVAPAVRRYRDALARLLPHGRTGGKVGLVGLPGGAACYRAAIRRQTGLGRTPEELHALGLAEIARIDAELVALGNRALPHATPLDLAHVIAALREDRALRFADGSEIMAAGAAALERARAAMPTYVGRQPRTACTVREIPAHEAPFTTVAYYNPPHPGSGKPGEYFINTLAPATRARFELEALTFHESIPGHHLQIALAQEQAALPLFRRHLASNAFSEGWALYTERLADELGLYSSDLDRLGMVSFDAWRASRLVVDTGIHALGWTREQAEAFMRAHTALSLDNIANEVDRYIVWPGQALGYKLGQLEIRALRAEAEAALGPRFDLRGFHDAVLGGAAVSLPVLRRRIEAWIATRRARPEG